MKKTEYLFVSILLTLFMSFENCQTLASQTPMKIAVTKVSKNYNNWLLTVDKNLVIVDLYQMKLAEAITALQSCSGLLVTGGEDVQPELYGKSDEKSRCKEPDPRRDTLEITMIKEAIKLNLPILGICRGEQIINVTLGGTLITDIPMYFSSKVEQPTSNIQHQCENYLTCFHAVTSVKKTTLNTVVISDSGFVTSNHHQAIDKLALGLIPNAFSADGIIEGVEWENPSGKNFLLAVQWHPERMDISNSYSGKILGEFYNQAKRFNSNR